MPAEERGIDLDSVQTVAFSTVGGSTGSEVARMLRLAADAIEHVDAEIQHMSAYSDQGDARPVLHLRFFWIVERPGDQ